MASARKHISTLVVILMTAFCLAEDEKSKHHPPPPPPCGHAVCEGYNDDLGFVIAEKTITFRLKLDEDPCGIQGGQQCGPKPEEPPKMDKPKVESEEDSMEKEHNDSMANSTMETPKEMDMEEKKTPPPPPPPTIPALMGPSSVERHNGKVCKKVAVATMVGWFFLERSKSSGGEFVNSRGNKIKTGAMFSSPSCQVTEKMMIPNSASTSNPGKNVAASHFRLKVDFPGVLNGSNASLMIDFYVMLEDGNYTYEGETVLVSKGHVRISFNISDVENWFCDGSLCADYAKLGFKVNVEKPHFPKAVALNDVMCTNDTCTKSAHIIDNTRIGMLLLVSCFTFLVQGKCYQGTHDGR